MRKSLPRRRRGLSKKSAQGALPIVRSVIRMSSIETDKTFSNGCSGCLFMFFLLYSQFYYHDFRLKSTRSRKISIYCFQEVRINRMNLIFLGDGAPRRCQERRPPVSQNRHGPCGNLFQDNRTCRRPVPRGSDNRYSHPVRRKSMKRKRDRD